MLLFSFAFTALLPWASTDPFEEDFNPNRSEVKIVERLLASYNSKVRPAFDARQTTQVFIDTALTSILELTEAREELLFAQILMLRWRDPFIQWDPKDFGGLDAIRIPVTHVWYPDLVIYGMIEVDNAIDPDLNYVKFNSTGHTYSSSLQNVKVHCAFKVALFPFDTQNCSVHYGSWMYSKQELELIPWAETGDLKLYQGNAGWDLKAYTVKRLINEYTSGNYSDVYINIILQRKPLYYMVTIVGPCFVITCLAVIGIFSPFNNSGERQEKVSQGLTTLLTLAVMLLIITQQMPRSSEGLPLLGLFVMMELAVSAIATLMAVGIMYLHRQGTERSPAHLLLRLLCLAPQAALVRHASWIREKSAQSRCQTPLISGGVRSEDSSAARLLKPCLENICRIRDILVEIRAEQQIAALWVKVCSRLDNLCMAALLLGNLILSLALFLWYPMQ